jgi:hypothetical protein
LLIVGFTKPTVTRRWWRSYLVQGLALAGILVVRYFLFPDPYFVGVRLRHRGVEEARFLDFAKTARGALEHHGRLDSSLNTLTFPSGFTDAAEVDRARAFEALLPGSVFERWPRSLLRLSIDKDSVTVLRGSGMMGIIGIQIFDTDGEPVLSDENPLAAGNPYIPRQRVLFDRVYFIDGN